MAGLFISANRLPAQSNQYVFSHLTTANGLLGNNVRSVTVDKNGFLWVATSEGLNKYDGYSVIPFLKEKYPVIPSNDLNAICCDRKNRIWLADDKGLSLIDEDRAIRKIKVDSFENFTSGMVLETKSAGIIVLGVKSDYSLADADDPMKPSNWKSLTWASPLLHKDVIHDVICLEDDRFLFVQANRIIIVDFAKKQTILDMELAIAWSGCSINQNEIMIASQRGLLSRVNIAEQRVTKTYLLRGDLKSSETNTSITKIRAVSDSEIIIATYFRGIYSFNSHDETFHQYQHDPLNTFSISENRTDNIFSDNAGNIFVGTHSGLNIFNNRHYKANYLPAFSDSKGNIFDGYINDVALDKKQRIWMAAFDKLILTDREKKTTRFFPFYYDMDGLGARPLEIKTVCVDSVGNIWASAYEKGVLLLNEQTGNYKIITKQDTVLHEKSPLGSVFMHDLVQGPDGRIWGCSGLGVFAIDPKTLQVDPFVNHPVLKELIGKRFFKIFCDANQNLWFASQSNGVYRYDLKNNTLKNYTEKEGLPSLSCSNFAEDNWGDIFISTSNGLAMLSPDGRIKVFNRTNGLKSNVCTGLLADKEGNIWIANNNIMICYSPREDLFKYFGNESGFPGAVFRTNAFFRSADGKMFWGTEKGIIYFRPELLSTVSEPLNVNISELILTDSVIQLTHSASFFLSHDNNDISLKFSAIDLAGSRNIFYQYMLEGFDRQWNKGTDITQMQYNTLPPGGYTFKVRASKDGVNWTNASNTIYINIALPFWKTWWFILLCLLTTAAIIYYLNRLARHRRKERETLRINYEKKIAAVEMNALRAQMNPHFIFNSLNSINTFILKNDQDNASDYLNKFSQLVRLILDNSRNDWVLLGNELKALELYIDLESIRFENIFTHSINIAPDVQLSSVMIPPLIIQPYVENAIRHGLVNRKTPGGKLSIRVWIENEELLIKVEDNGIGRAGSESLNKDRNILHRSHGMKITAERIAIVNEIYKVNAGVKITDLDDLDENKGTRVLITIQYRTNAGNNH